MDKPEHGETPDTPASDGKESVRAGRGDSRDSTLGEDARCIVIEKFWNVALGFARWTTDQQSHLDDCPRCQSRWERTSSAVEKRRHENLPAVQEELRRTSNLVQSRRHISASTLLSWPIEESRFNMSDPVSDLWQQLNIRPEKDDCIRLTFPRAHDVMFVLIRLEMGDQLPLASTSRYAILYWGESTSIAIKDIFQNRGSARFSVDLIGSAAALQEDETTQLFDDASRSPAGSADHKVWVEWSRHWLRDGRKPGAKVRSILHQINEDV